jgi:uncharacterized cupin superfamily protein
MKRLVIMPKIDIANLPIDTRTGYPPPLNRVVEGRSRKRLGNAVGLDQFGVYVLEGEVVLIEDDGETVLKPGDAAGFKANTPNGHHLVNKSQRDAVFLEIGTRSKVETASYPDVDLVAIRDEAGMRYTRKNGEPHT